MKAIVTGGAGFLGSHVAGRVLEKGGCAVVVDNFSRRGSEANAEWLKRLGGALVLVEEDIREADAVGEVIARHRDADLVLHAAAQVAVTSSVSDPRTDLEINVIGTFNVLEAMRHTGARGLLVYTSTNKVYGGLEHIPIVEDLTRYRYADRDGIDESQPLDFHSPYACSKGGAEWYVRDYARTFGLRTAVFRNSCIYGPQQFGVEDQGWVAWFTIASLLGREVSIYGDGKQVRDLLYVDDWVDAVLAAAQNPDASGGVFNIGGGPGQSISVWVEFNELLGAVVGRVPTVSQRDWRVGDQKVYVSDIGTARRCLSWAPRVDLKSGLCCLRDWAAANLRTIECVLEQQDKA